MRLSENTNSNRSLWRNKERVPLANPPLKSELKETTSWTTVDQAKDIASSPNPVVEALCRGRHWVRGPTRRRAIKAGVKHSYQLRFQVHNANRVNHDGIESSKLWKSYIQEIEFPIEGMEWSILSQRHLTQLFTTNCRNKLPLYK